MAISGREPNNAIRVHNDGSLRFLREYPQRMKIKRLLQENRKHKLAAVALSGSTLIHRSLHPLPVSI